MVTLLAGVAAYSVLFTLVIAVVEHLRAPRALPAALVAHGVLPRAGAVLVAACVIAAETALGIVLLVGLLGVTGVVPVALVASGVLFACYGGYGLLVISTGRVGPCGCGGVEVPMDGWVAGRAFALAVMALSAAASGTVPQLTTFDSPLLVTLLAAATFTALLWQLPAARHDRLDDRSALRSVAP
ncbi:MAG: methylamine utilization protein MauE [Actinomycetota bacterium]|nr:methylamine utilization protein MauE [Actinomycetota bacterium]